ncbi:MAG: ABC transporter ATP-binding protein [Erysipelothrix sp.]|nr:ABC transporter ATP-binding protein [Erysipelothrix sp.]
MIEVKSLVKSYGKFVAVNRLDLTAYDGQITVLLGPNGAGKSTTIKSIAGLLKFTGKIYVNGFENRSIEAKRSFGYVAEMPAHYDLLTIDEHLNFIEKAYQLKDIDEYRESLLKRFELSQYRHKIAKDLSKGMAQKLSLLCALLIQPQALLVDEPLVGLDPHSIEEVIRVFKELKSQGASILLSTHIIDMIDSIWDVAYIMHEGEIKKRVERKELSDNRTLKEIFFEVTEHE